jgi:superoxide reductase
MSDAPILGGINKPADPSATSDFEKKHSPYIQAATHGDKTLVSVTVGHEVAHPNQPDHHISWIELLVGEAPIARFDLAPVVADPHVSVILDLPSGTTVRAIEHCTLHGLWESELAL